MLIFTTIRAISYGSMQHRSYHKVTRFVIILYSCYNKKPKASDIPEKGNIFNDFYVII